MKVTCNECGKHLIDVPDGAEGIGFQIRMAGFVFKLPILYGCNTPLYFCSDECTKKYYREHFNPKQHADAALITQEIRKNIPRMARETAHASQRFYELLKRIGGGKYL